MANELVKRFIKKDGSQRISFYREEYAENPRVMWDFPLHCEDFCREYSIMLPTDKNSKSEDKRELMRYLLITFGYEQKALAILKANAKGLSHNEYDDCLMYDKHDREWKLMEWRKLFGTSDWGWREEAGYDCKFDELDLNDVTLYASDECLYQLLQTCLTNEIRIAGYEFGYYGAISFSNSVDKDSDGICWLEKKEFLKWGGNSEEYWDTHDLMYIAGGMITELEAWGANEVYRFEVEEAIKSRTYKTYLNVEREDEEYETTEWEHYDSCGGFYGELDDILPDMFDCAGLKIEDFEEEKEDNE